MQSTMTPSAIAQKSKAKARLVATVLLFAQSRICFRNLANPREERR
jgi:hypothetical protein